MEMLEITDTLDRQSRQLRLQNFLGLAIAILLAAIAFQLHRIHPIELTEAPTPTGEDGPHTGLIPDDMLAITLPTE